MVETKNSERTRRVIRNTYTHTQDSERKTYWTHGQMFSVKTRAIREHRPFVYIYISRASPMDRGHRNWHTHTHKHKHNTHGIQKDRRFLKSPRGYLFLHRVTVSFVSVPLVNVAELRGF